MLMRLFIGEFVLGKDVPDTCLQSQSKALKSRRAEEKKEINEGGKGGRV